MSDFGLSTTFIDFNFDALTESPSFNKLNFSNLSLLSLEYFKYDFILQFNLSATIDFYVTTSDLILIL